MHIYFDCLIERQGNVANDTRDNENTIQSVRFLGLFWK